jgi:hypothetical protein
MGQLRYKTFSFFLVTVILFGFQVSLAQQTETHWLIGRWEGEIGRFRGQGGPLRTLRVTEVSPDGKARAMWGIAGEFSFRPDVRVEGVQVKIVTGSKSVVELMRQGDTLLAGTFTTVKGRVFPIKLAKVKPSTEIDGQKQVTQPSFKEGDFWQFRIVPRLGGATDTAVLNGDYEVVFLGNQFKLFQIGEGEKVEIQPVFNGNLVDLSFYAAELIRVLDSRQPELQYLEFPLFVGKVWTTQYRVKVGRILVLTFTAETRATEIEEIRTLAGRFRAFKMERNVVGFYAPYDPHNRDIPYRVLSTYYYSPETRSIVRYIKGGAGGGVNLQLMRFGTIGQ